MLLRTLLRIQVHLHVHIRLHLAADTFLGHDILERHVADKLRKNAHFNLWGLRLGCAIFGHITLQHICLSGT